MLGLLFQHFVMFHFPLLLLILLRVLLLRRDVILCRAVLWSGFSLARSAMLRLRLKSAVRLCGSFMIHRLESMTLCGRAFLVLPEIPTNDRHLLRAPGPWSPRSPSPCVASLSDCLFGW